MPTPVGVARQCLTTEAAHALDEAVAVARRRGHAQTTSLHAVSALLSLPSSTLRDSCARARNTAYSPRLQFKALELCLSVSLDRVPSTQLSDDPPVSNSLMAAIKRSQANQRRQPENFHLYNQLSQQSSVACVKVELQHLILSILDDPVVSRVFGESGFRSSEIKLAIIRPFPQLVRYSSRSKGPPLFLCNLKEYPNQGFRGSGVSFSGFPINGDENSRRIGEVLGKKQGRNPLLIGVSAYDALNCFIKAVEKQSDGVLPVELSGLKVMNIENDVVKFITENSDKGSVNMRFREVGEKVEGSLGPGLVVNLGDLKGFVGDNNMGGDRVNHVVAELTRLIKANGEKIWLIGSTASYEIYLKFIGKYRWIEKEWDLLPLPITSLKPSSISESYPRSSLMDSFVPFGGFFSTTSDFRVVLSNTPQCVSRCNICNEKCEQEVKEVSKGGFSCSVADGYQSSLPSWLKMAELGSANGLDLKTRDDGMVVLSANVAGIKKKWDNICQRLHHRNQLVRESNSFPTLVGFQIAETKGKNENANNNNHPDAPSNKLKSSDLNSFPPIDLPNDSIKSNQYTDTSPASAGSATIDLELGICSPQSDSKLKRRNTSKSNTDHSQQFSVQCSSCSSTDCAVKKFDWRDVKTLRRCLTERVNGQDEAVIVISETIARCRTGNQSRRGATLRGDIWFNFVGPDTVGKMKVALALAEILYGDKDQHFICVDVSSEEETIYTELRGKTVVDFIAGELSKKPLSVVFLENIDKADSLVHNNLSLAVRSGKFSNSHGREVSINNTVFITTSSALSEDKLTLSSRKETSNYSEERILRTKNSPMHITIGQSENTVMNKRKLIVINELSDQHTISDMAKRAHMTSNRCLDLNVPAEENEIQDVDPGSSDDDSVSEDFKAWFHNFAGHVDETVVFTPFDFNKLAENFGKEINVTFRRVFGSDCLLEIEPKVMEQLLAASYASYGYREVEKWVEQVLSRGFLEAKRNYNLSSNSIVKLVSSEGFFMEEQASETGLPSRIILT